MSTGTEKKKVVITGVKMMRILGIIGLLAIIVAAIVVGIRESAPFALFTDAPYILAGVVLFIIPMIVPEKKDKEQK